MTAYIINEIWITDLEDFQTYAVQVPPIIDKYGGRYVVRGGPVVMVDGEPEPDRVVVLEFPSVEQARAWRTSPEYTAVLPIRNRSSTSRVFIVEGYKP
ncbi:DUF1330 domain-containing protein [Phenylobacterium sp. J367]|uniref:DUF1330 domain-containing protein n=1 Tax=Phenylobacterium sp. J367 TaxID=2898435 RepID=UPI002151FABF|nr:DUF1330 domain-containing protein [Phenylobacterium sp. J367]MCR5877943.1 DUF1330 domain-containing protein [Phenylobacterium sp. J367]